MIPAAQMAQPRRWRGDEGFSLTPASQDIPQHRLELKLLAGAEPATSKHDEKICALLECLHPERPHP